MTDDFDFILPFLLKYFPSIADFKLFLAKIGKNIDDYSVDGGREALYQNVLVYAQARNWRAKFIKKLLEEEWLGKKDREQLVALLEAQQDAEDGIDTAAVPAEAADGDEACSLVAHSAEDAKDPFDLVDIVFEPRFAGVLVEMREAADIAQRYDALNTSFRDVLNAAGPIEAKPSEADLHDLFPELSINFFAQTLMSSSQFNRKRRGHLNDVFL